MKESKILISTEDDSLRQRLKTRLLDSGYAVIDSTNHNFALNTLREDRLDLIILGTSLSDARDVLSVAQQIRHFDRQIPLIMITANSSEELAIAALKLGVDDYFKQPFSLEKLDTALTRCLSSFPPEEMATSKSIPSPLIGGEVMIGDNPLLNEIKAYILKVAPTDSSVLITGETGTGKELVAQLIHNNSPRRQRPMVCINCAAIPDGLLESELFGHEKGAFTGAHSPQEGKLKLAEAGTVFFDEIGDMSSHAQSKILRTLESREVYRLGGKSSTHANIRVVAATNQDLEQLTDQGKFRKDLFFRLNVARIVLPPLRSRKEDIPQLLAHFIGRFNRQFGQQIEGIDDQALQYLLRHDWPGNVRELKNLLEATFLSCPSRRIQLTDLPEKFRLWCDSIQDTPLTEQERLLAALYSTNWNKSRAAKRLHWSRMTIYRKIAKYHLTRADNKSGLTLPSQRG